MFGSHAHVTQARPGWHKVVSWGHAVLPMEDRPGSLCDKRCRVLHVLPQRRDFPATFSAIGRDEDRGRRRLTSQVVAMPL